MEKRVLVIMLILIMSQSCEYLVDHVYFIEVQNNSDVAVRCYASYSYPDTSLDLTKPRLQLINPKSYTKIDSKEKWYKVLPNDTLEIFIISEDTLIKYSWDLIKSDYKILKRFDLSVKDIEQMSSTVIYQ